MAKAPDAFRSISEVAEALGVRQHTLRAWETRFPFVRPVKRADGRRYYRPADVAMLTELDRLLKAGTMSTEDILRLHRAGGLTPERADAPSPKPAITADPRQRLRDHLTALTAARQRLAEALG